MSDGFGANLSICVTHSIQKKIPTLSEKEILHGVLNDRSSSSILNHLILIGNYFLYSNALEDNIKKKLYLQTILTLFMKNYQWKNISLL